MLNELLNYYFLKIIIKTENSKILNLNKSIKKKSKRE